MYKLFLDDERFPKTDDWVIVRSFEEFKDTIMKKGIPAEISFDHDLGSGNFRWKISVFLKKLFGKKFEQFPPNGYDCAKWLINDMQFDLRKISINVHSANPVGKDNIEGLVKSWIKFLNENR